MIETKDKLIIKTRLNSGAFGMVYQAHSPGSFISYAVKVPLKSNKNKNDFINEIRFLKKLKHPNILRIVDQSNFQIEGLPEFHENAIISPHYSNGDLISWISKHGPIPPKITRTLFKQLLSAINHIHPKSSCPGVAHRDIKMENVVLSDSFSPILIDFGFAINAQNCKEGANCSFRSGTEGYIPPECYSGKYNAVDSDIFGLCVVLFCMLVGCNPFDSTTSQDQRYYYFWKGLSSIYWKHYSKNLPEDDRENLIHFFNCMFDPVPKNRLSISEILRHPWMNGECASQCEVYLYMIKKKNQPKFFGQSN